VRIINQVLNIEKVSKSFRKWISGSLKWKWAEWSKRLDHQNNFARQHVTVKIGVIRS